MNDTRSQDAGVFKELRERREQDRRERGREEKNPWKGREQKGKGEGSQ